MKRQPQICTALLCESVAVFQHARPPLNSTPIKHPHLHWYFLTPQTNTKNHNTNQGKNHDPPQITPADAYEQVLWCEYLENALAALIPLMNAQYHTAVTAIITNNLQNPQYELLQPQTPCRRINFGLLHETLPDIYQKIIHLKATYAEKITGRTELYRLARQTDLARTDTLACADIGDLQKILRPKK